MPPTAILANDLATARDSLGRLFDALRFKPARDKLGRWINARAGRKPKPGASKSARPSRPSPCPAMSTAPAPATAPDSQASALSSLSEAAPASATPPPAPASADAPAADPAPAAPAQTTAPDFSDIERAAGPAAPAASAAPGEYPAEASDLAGMTTAESIIGIIQTALVLIGDDEGVLTKAEKMALRPPLERVLKKYNVGADALPAEVDLAVALALIVVARLQKPKTATFFAKVRAWFTGKLAEHKGRALAAQVREANAE